jgi:hypothetical protein
LKYQTLVVFACVGVAVLGTACSSEEREPLVQPRSHAGADGTGARGGATARGGASTGGDDPGGAPSGGATSGGATSGGATTTGGTGGTGSTSDIFDFDGDEVYLTGRFNLESGFRAVAPVLSPDPYVTGFSAYHGPHTLRLGEAGLYYSSSALVDGGGMVITIYRFVPDAVTSAPPGTYSYPQDTERNDIAIATPACDDEVESVFIVGPEDAIVYQCRDGLWYLGGAMVYDGVGTILSLGHDNLALVDPDPPTMPDSNTELEILNLENGETIPIEGSGYGAVAARTTAEGFRYVSSAFDASLGPALVDVAADGTWSIVGRYPVWPEGVYAPRSYRLAANWDLYSIVTLSENIEHDAVVRSRLDGESEIVYSDADDPWLLAHGAYLFTGP